MCTKLQCCSVKALKSVKQGSLVFRIAVFFCCFESTIILIHTMRHDCLRLNLQPEIIDKVFSYLLPLSIGRHLYYNSIINHINFRLWLIRNYKNKTGSRFFSIARQILKDGYLSYFLFGLFLTSGYFLKLNFSLLETKIWLW